MDDVFVCPECGSPVAISGLAPGRQVRCPFCRRLLEVPYLPRVVKTKWRRKRFGRPWWVIAAWGLIGLAATMVFTVAAVQFFIRRERANREQSIASLEASADIAESEGDLARAIHDLDSAIELRGGSTEAERKQRSQLQTRRQSLNRRDAQTVLERLKGHDSVEVSLEDWRKLQARVDADRDLVPLRSLVQQAYAQKIDLRIASLLASAEGSLASGKASDALATGLSVWNLLAKAPARDPAAIRRRLEELVDRLVERYGMLIDPIRGQLINNEGVRSNSRLIPVLTQAATTKGYVPQPETSPWRDRWVKAPYRLILELDERYDRTYLTSENRLTRIDARLFLIVRGRQFWETAPSARTPVPLPNLPAYLSGQLALSHERTDAIELLLYERARTAFAEKLVLALERLPACGQPP